MMPVMFENLLCLHVLGVNHQSAGITVKTMDNMSSAFLTSAAEVFVEHGLDIQGTVTGCHAEDSYVLLYHDEVLVLID